MCLSTLINLSLYLKGLVIRCDIHSPTQRESSHFVKGQRCPLVADKQHYSSKKRVASCIKSPENALFKNCFRRFSHKSAKKSRKHSFIHNEMDEMQADHGICLI